MGHNAWKKAERPAVVKKSWAELEELPILNIYDMLDDWTEQH